MTCLDNHRVRLFDGRVYLWWNHTNSDPHLVQLIQAYGSDDMIKYLARNPTTSALLTNSGSEEDRELVDWLLYAGYISIWLTPPYAALSAAYRNANITWPNKKPLEDETQYAHRISIYCEAEAPLIQNYFAECAQGMEMLRVSQPEHIITQIHGVFAQLAAQTAGTVRQAYDELRQMEHLTQGPSVWDKIE